MLSALNNRYNLKKALRIALLIMADILVINLVSFSALLLRFEFNLQDMIDSGFLSELNRIWLLNTAVTLGIFVAFRLYGSLWRFASVEELMHIGFASAAVAVFHAVCILSGIYHLPKSFPILVSILVFCVTTAVRFSYRAARRVRIALHQGQRARTMLIGAGQAGFSVLREFRNSQFSRNDVVCIIDDDPAKRGSYLMDVRVVGGRDKILDAAKKYDVSEIVLAIPTLSPSAKKEIWEICQKTGCKMKQLPGIYQLANGEVSIQSIRDIQIEDLLERDVIHVDMGGISSHIQGKTVMVTGGGGSIGSELCRQLASYKPSDLVIFDIYENNAYAIQQELKNTYPNLTVHVLIGSVRDAARIGSVMKTYKPALVFHAAAHKHVPLMEDSPLEAIKNNVFGTLNTALAAAQNHVSHFVLISTDKAVNPTSVMGATKRICELIIQMMDQQSETNFAAVRFGNVLGSNGSVIPLFREQIKRGGPVTVTHPDINRFFMTIPEAVSLVLQAGTYAKGGEIFILDMGQPVKIDDLARNMIRLSGFEPDVDIPVVYTGLRPGEKLYEELLLNEEGLTKTANDLIYVAHRTEFDKAEFLAKLERLHNLTEEEADQVCDCIRAIVPTFGSVMAEVG